MADLVDRPDPEARRKRADELARDDEIDLDGLRTAMLSFRPRGGGRTGTFTADARLVLPRETGNGYEPVGARIAFHVPSGYTPRKPAPLLLALHGAGGRGRNQVDLWRDVAERAGMIVAAPDEPGENRGYGFTARERAAAMAALRWVRRRYNVDENRIHLAGVSRGGHMTWDLATRRPDRWASLAPMIGGPRFDPRHGQNNLRYIPNIAHLPLRCLQGARDQPGLIFNLKLAFERLEKAGAPDAELKLFPGLGHSFRFGAVDWPAFLAAAERDPARRRVVRLATSTGAARAAWIEITRLDRRVRESFTPRIVASRWNALDAKGKKRYVAEAADGRTARLEVVMKAPGRFEAGSERVRGFRLLLAPGMFEDDEPVTVEWNGRTRRKTVRTSKRVLLREFAERFDRTFLPVATVELP